MTPALAAAVAFLVRTLGGEAVRAVGDALEITDEERELRARRLLLRIEEDRELVELHTAAGDHRRALHALRRQYRRERRAVRVGA